MRSLQRVSVAIFYPPCVSIPALYTLHTKLWRKGEREAQALRQVRGQGLDNGHKSGK